MGLWPKRGLAGRPPRPRWSTAEPLRLLPDLVLPLRQDVPLAEFSWPHVTDAIRQTLGSAGFQIVSISEAPGSGPPASRPGFPGRSETVAERRRRSVPMPAPAKVSVYALFGAGLALGVFDALAVQTPLVALPWAGGAAAVAFLFWYRYARSFDSEVVVVVLRPSAPAARSAGPAIGPTASLAWFAGQVRSHARGSSRVSAEVWVPPGLAREVGALTRDFLARLAAPTPN